MCESECGAFSPAGIYRYPEERFTARLAGIHEVGRRNLTGEMLAVRAGDQQLTLGMAQWMTPWQMENGTVLGGEPGRRAGHRGGGRQRAPDPGGQLPGRILFRKLDARFRAFLLHIARSSGWQPEIEVLSQQPSRDAFVYIKYGTALGSAWPLSSSRPAATRPPCASPPASSRAAKPKTSSPGG